MKLGKENLPEATQLAQTIAKQLSLNQPDYKAHVCPFCYS